jgi:hypothetical protein
MLPVVRRKLRPPSPSASLISGGSRVLEWCGSNQGSPATHQAEGGQAAWAGQQQQHRCIGGGKSPVQDPGTRAAFGYCIEEVR